MLTDGSPASMTRTFTSGTNIIDQPGTWAYTKTIRSQGLTSTTVIDPSSAGNETDLNFSGTYETQRTTYSGNGSSKSELKDTYSCFNGNNSNCQTASVSTPITYRAYYQDFPVNAYYEYSYDSYGNLASEVDHDFTSGNPKLRTITITPNTALYSHNIYNRPASIDRRWFWY